jgi:hypothetical protein
VLSKPGIGWAGFQQFDLVEQCGICKEHFQLVGDEEASRAVMNKHVNPQI